MSLGDFAVERRPITISDGVTFHVRAITPFDISIIMQNFAGQMLEAFTRTRKTVGTGRKISTDEVQSLVMDLIQSTPDVVCAMADIAADEPEEMDKVRLLPLPVMTDALLTIYDLTFTSEESLKKFVAGILRVVETMTALILDKMKTTTAPGSIPSS